MNRAVLVKTLRDTLPLTVTLILGILILEVVFVRVAREVSPGLEIVANNVFLRKMVRLSLGADLFADLNPTSYVTIGLVHPLLFAMVYTFVLTTCTRVLAGEIDGGTADLLLTRPVSRCAVYVSTSAVWIGAATVLSLTPWLGIAIAEQFSPFKQPIELHRFGIAVVNLAAYVICIGALTTLFSAIVNRRIAAIAAMLGVLFASYALNFIAQFWTPAERVAWLSLMNYYSPLAVVRTQTWPVLDLGVLLGLSAVTWLAGLIYFTRRDVAT